MCMFFGMSTHGQTDTSRDTEVGLVDAMRRVEEAAFWRKCEFVGNWRFANSRIRIYIYTIVYIHTESIHIHFSTCYLRGVSRQDVNGKDFQLLNNGIRSCRVRTPSSSFLYVGTLVSLHLSAKKVTKTGR